MRILNFMSPNNSENTTENTATTDSSVTSSSADGIADKSGNQLRRSTSAPKTLSTAPTAETQESIAKALQTVLDGDFPEAREETRSLLADPDILPRTDLDLEQSRARTTEHLQRVLESGMPKHAFRADQGGTGETGRCLTSIEMLGHADLSLMVKSGVQWGLFGGAVGNLGTERHQEMVGKLMNLEALGCFAMTERGHGSDVQQLETTATYDAETQEFIINSPTASAEKWFIGNAARDGRWAAVFAQLIVPGAKNATEAGDGPAAESGATESSSGAQAESQGVHCLLVRIREDDGSPIDGVRIGDHGHKGGLKGVDNGTISFDNHHVPREALLNRFADVDEAGNYTSPIENPNRRFFTMLGALVRGRVTVGAAAGAAARTALDIAVTYANLRRQFAPDDSLPENRLIEHRWHRLRLIPRVARAYGLQFATNKLIARVHELDQRGVEPTEYTKEQQADQREVEAHAAALKAANTAHATVTIQETREACGGAGYMAENLLTTLKADSDVFTTFEGDNIVMMQLAGKELMTGFAKELGGLNPMEMVRFGLDSFGNLLRRRTAADALIQNLVDTFSDSEETSLFDLAYQINLLSEREDRLMRSLARRLRPARKMDVDEAAKVVDRAQDHLLAVGWAHVDRIIFEAFVEAESKLDSEDAQRVLEQVRLVYFLSCIVDNASWYLEQNLLTGTRTKAARAALNDLVDSLGPWSQTLVDAFGIPDHITDLKLMEGYEAMVPKYESDPAAGQAG